MLKSGGGFLSQAFGGPADQFVAGDFDGDGKTDIAVYGYGRLAVAESGGGFISKPFGGPADRFVTTAPGITASSVGASVSRATAQADPSPAASGSALAQPTATGIQGATQPGDARHDRGGLLRVGVNNEAHEPGAGRDCHSIPGGRVRPVAAESGPKARPRPGGPRPDRPGGTTPDDRLTGKSRREGTKDTKTRIHEFS